MEDRAEERGQKEIERLVESEGWKRAVALLKQKVAREVDVRSIKTRGSTKESIAVEVIARAKLAEIMVEWILEVESIAEMAKNRTEEQETPTFIRDIS